jgi:N-sulfoglucosamine sulfohydrolase
MGHPQGLDDPETEPPSWDDLANTTRIAYPDMDASPTKAWLVHHRGDKQVRKLFEMGFGKFPAEELYDLREDPYYMRNLAGNSSCEEIRKELSDRLMGVLEEQGDPRVTEPNCRFERSPFTDAPE